MGEKSQVPVQLFLYTQTWSQAPSLSPEGPCQQELLERIFLKGKGPEELRSWWTERCLQGYLLNAGTCVVISKVLIVFRELEYY